MSTQEQPTFFATQIAQNNAQSPQAESKPQPAIVSPTSLPEPSAKGQQNPHSLKQLLTAFNTYDKQEKGLIRLQNAKQIFVGKGFDQNAVLNFYALSLPQFDNMLSFDEFLFVYYLNQHALLDSQSKSDLSYQVDQRLIDFLKLLNNYRKKSERKGNYKEAKNSKTKVQEIRQRQLARRNQYLKTIAEKEYSETEQRQRQKFEQFCIKWDKFMNDYQATATELLGKVRERQATQIIQFQDRNREELGSKMHYSKYLLQLETRQKKLVKVQEYEQAAKVKQQIEQIRARQERGKQIADFEVLEMRVKNFKKQQETTLNTLLQKIQKDRNDHLKQRQGETQKMMIRNKAALTAIQHRYTDNQKKVYESLHNLSLDRPSTAN